SAAGSVSAGCVSMKPSRAPVWGSRSSATWRCHTVAGSSLAHRATAGYSRSSISPLPEDDRSSGPFRYGRHRGQNAVHISPGLQAEHGSAVVEQVEFHVAPPPDQLLLALGFRPGFVPVAPDELRIDVPERPPDVLRESKCGFPPAICFWRRQVIIEDAADTAHFFPVR